MLSQESLKRDLFLLILRVLREKALVATMNPAPDHHQVDADQPPGGGQRDDVGVHAPAAADELGLAHLGKRTDLVAVSRGLFVSLLHCGPVHTLFQAVDCLVFPALQEQLRALDVFGVVGFADQAHAGSGTTLYLVQQARPRAVGEHRVLAGAQPEYFLHQLNAFAHCPGVGKRAEVAMGLVQGAAMEAKPGKAVAGQDDMWVRFIVSI